MKTTIVGLDEFTGDLKRMSAVVRTKTVVDALEAGAVVIQAYGQDNIRTQLNKNPTGFLANSLTIKKLEKAVHVGVFGVVYAKIHEYGGVIRARGKYLTFIGSDGKRVFTKSVTIPARPYMRPAVDGHLAEIKEAIADALRGLLKKAVS